MLLKNLEIHDFRGFRRFRIPRLGRINLLVGTNNSGKTSILEAVDILTASGDFSPFWLALRRRGEELRTDFGLQPSEDSIPQVDVRRLFRGHTLGVGRRFELAGESDRGELGMSALIEEVAVDTSSLPKANVRSSMDSFPRSLRLSLSWKGDSPRDLSLPLGNRGGLPGGSIFTYVPEDPDRRSPIRFITAMSLTVNDAAKLFDQIVLTP